jgi:hypothetical protein
LSPHRVQRQAAVSLMLGVVALIALVVSVWLVGVRSADDLRSAQESGLRAQTRQLQARCAVGIARDFESLDTNRDLRDFASDAAVARRRSGDFDIARRYTQRAQSAQSRMDRIALRLPASSDPVTVARFCVALFPMP